MRRQIFLTLALAAQTMVTACSAPTIAERNAAYSPTTGEKMDQVVNQPFSDFNLSNTEIPILLAKVSAAPYAPPAENTCPGLRKEIAALGQVLGPDIEPTVFDKNGNIISGGRAGEAAWGSARGAAEGWIPFHGVVREMSGAASHDRMVQQAILAGFVRRAYLKGLSQYLLCPA
jgi:hypothetical protein